MMRAFNYLGYSLGNFPISEKLSDNILSLPMHPYLTELQQKEILNYIV